MTMTDNVITATEMAERFVKEYNANPRRLSDLLTKYNAEQVARTADSCTGVLPDGSRIIVSNNVENGKRKVEAVLTQAQYVMSMLSSSPQDGITDRARLQGLIKMFGYMRNVKAANSFVTDDDVYQFTDNSAIALCDNGQNLVFSKEAFKSLYTKTLSVSREPRTDLIYAIPEQLPKWYTTAEWQRMDKEHFGPIDQQSLWLRRFGYYHVYEMRTGALTAASCEKP